MCFFFSVNEHPGSIIKLGYIEKMLNKFVDKRFKMVLLSKK